MKKTVLCIAVAVLSITAGSAQEKGLKQSKFWDNWFIQGQVGGSYMFAEGQNASSIGDVTSPHAAISFGKYFAPMVAGRIQVGGWQEKTYLGKEIDKSYTNKYIQVSADGLLSLVNLLTPYNENRVFDLSLLGGVAYVGGESKNYPEYGTYVPQTNQLIPRLGLQADLKLTKNLSVNLEAVCNFMRDDFNGRDYRHEYDEVVNGLLGLTYRFGEGFKTVEATTDLSELRALNEKLNEQKALLNGKEAEINKLKGQLANQPTSTGEAKVVTKDIVKTEVLMNAIVVFPLNSSRIPENQEINVYNAAKYLKENPDVKVAITGYADKNTGTSAINQRLSEERVQAVKNALINKYGISESRISSRAQGDKEQLFPTPEWNRVVVFTALGK